MVIHKLINYQSPPKLTRVMRSLGHFGLKNHAILGRFALGNFTILGTKCRIIFGIKCRVIFGPLCSGEFRDPKS